MSWHPRIRRIREESSGPNSSTNLLSRSSDNSPLTSPRPSLDGRPSMEVELPPIEPSSVPSISVPLPDPVMEDPQPIRDTVSIDMSKLPTRRLSRTDSGWRKSFFIKKQKKLPENIQQAVAQSGVNFEEKRVVKLYYAFIKFADKETGDMPYEGFNKLLGHEHEEDFCKRLFQGLDISKSGSISFVEFLKGLSLMDKEAPEDERFQFLERWFNLDEAIVEKEMFADMLETTAKENRMKVESSSLSEFVDDLYEHRESLDIREIIRESDVPMRSISFTLLGDKSRTKSKRQLHPINKAIQDITKDMESDSEEKEEAKRNFLVRWIHRHFQHEMGFTIAVLYWVINIALFSVIFCLRRFTPHFKVWGYAFTVANSSAMVLRFNCALIILLVSKHLITGLRKMLFLNRFLPLDSNIEGHKHIAGVILVFSMLHAGAHYYDYWNIVEHLSVDSLNTVLYTKVTTMPSYWEFLFTTWSGITGHVMLVIFLLGYVTALFRRQSFRLFWIFHLLFIVFYIPLCFHGVGKMFDLPTTHYWVGVPFLILVVSWLISKFSRKYSPKVVEAQLLPSNVLCLKMLRPTGLRFRAGQFLYIRCPEVSVFEWHPFSITSAPNSEFLTFHIRIVGPWTRKLSMEFINSCSIPLQVEGPYGTPSEQYRDYKVLMLVGAGIGVTPFTSILQALKSKTSNKVKKVYFYWISRDYSSFEWFAQLLEEISADPRFLIQHYYTGGNTKSDVRSLLLQVAVNYSEKMNRKYFVTGTGTKLNFGRPNFDEICKEIQENHPDENIGVFACGPSAATEAVKIASTKFPKFAFHREIF